MNMKYEDLSIEKKEKIRKLLTEVGVTNEKVLEVRIKMLEFWDNDNKEKLLKPTEEEKEKLYELRYLYKRGCESDLKLTEQIFRLHKELLDSSSPKVRREVLERAEEIIEKYKQTMVDILQRLPVKK